MAQAWLAAAAANDLAFQQYVNANPQATEDQLVGWMQANPGPGPPPDAQTHMLYFNMVNGLPPPGQPLPPPGPVVHPVAPPPIADEVRYTDLVVGERYKLIARDPDPYEDENDDMPYEGVYVSFGDYGLSQVKFRDVTTAGGEQLDPGDTSEFYPLDFIFKRVVVVVVPPKPWPQRNIPPNTDDVVNQMEITEGMDMVDFHGEYGFGRYYPLEVYNELHLPKRNPITRQWILPADLQYYTAHIAPAGGRRRRKTKKSSRRMRKTRRRHS